MKYPNSPAKSYKVFVQSNLESPWRAQTKVEHWTTQQYHLGKQNEKYCLTDTTQTSTHIYRTMSKITLAIFHLIVFTCFHSNFGYVCFSMLANSQQSRVYGDCEQVHACIHWYLWNHLLALIDWYAEHLPLKQRLSNLPTPQHLLHLTLNKHSRNVCWEIRFHKTPSVLLSSSFHLPEYMTGSDTIRKNRECSANQVNRDLWPISVRANIAASCSGDIKDIFFFYKQHKHDIQLDVFAF